MDEETRRAWAEFWDAYYAEMDELLAEHVAPFVGPELRDALIAEDDERRKEQGE